MASSLVACSNDRQISTDSPYKSNLSTEKAVSPPSSSSSAKSFLDWHEFHFTSANTEPMFEVYSIRIFNKSFADDQEEKCQVYGTIRVVDSKTTRPYFLYNRGNGDEHLDVISFHHRDLTLNGPDNFVFAMEEPTIIFDIRDKATDAAIIVGCACLENATTAEFEKDLMLTIELEGVGTAYVDYTALRFGVAAYLEFRLVKYFEGDSDDGSDSDEESVDVCGSILAYHSNAYCGRKFASQFFYTKIFETQASESQVVKFESPINLSRQFVAVPAYSSLIIEFNLRDPDTDEPIFVGGTVVETHNYETRMCVSGESCQNYKMRVRVSWKQPFRLDESSYDRSMEYGERIATLPNGVVVSAHPLLEVFSVFIGRQNCEELSLHGKIEVCDAHLYCTLFEATEKDPYRLPSGCNTILLNGPPRTMTPGEFTNIFIDLMDVKGRIYIKGCAQSSHGLNKHHKSWHDRWLCSIVKGAQEDGFAAVNYMVMTYAIKYVVKVHFLSQGTAVFRDGLYGKIVAFYSKYKYKYKTDDDREYYRSVLFERSEDECFMPNGDITEVELSRSVVPVPIESSLLIQVQLKFGVVRDSVDETVWFQPWQNVSYFVIQGGSFAIRVSVEWNYGL
ncbi:hypothetical protein RND81_03G212500 [Saponaria officinalis]|uniref:DUF6598 domain-containing protein n=1 Tax=Saponaria officinalis TaxID=3572 RepID=A0AAW1MA80_SAPOF